MDSTSFSHYLRKAKNREQWKRKVESSSVATQLSKRLSKGHIRNMNCVFGGIHEYLRFSGISFIKSVIVDLLHFKENIEVFCLLFVGIFVFIKVFTCFIHFSSFPSAPFIIYIYCFDTLLKTGE